MRAYKDQTALSDTRELYLNNLLTEKDDEIKRLNKEVSMLEKKFLSWLMEDGECT